MAFAYQISHVTDYLANHGVTAIPGRRLNVQDMQGLNWIIRPSTTSTPMQPTEMESTNLIDGRISIRFAEYQPAPEDDDEITEHTALVLLDNDIWYRQRYYTPHKAIQANIVSTNTYQKRPYHVLTNSR
uniref:Uncharacterized protein n=1 Tax=Nymphaea colorata TaxID=210225 RepID=A0A5K1AE96_9MAGN